MKIVIGSDHFGFPLKEDLKKFLIESGFEPIDIGCGNSETPVDYPDVAFELAERVSDGEFDRGILVCGTGIGMAIVANKVPGIRAACCHDVYSTERAQKSNDAQIMTMGSQVITPILARKLLRIWLDSKYEGGRSAPKVAKIIELEKKLHKG
jgi:ribose 5-phosphate isomerase B